MVSQISKTSQIPNPNPKYHVNAHTKFHSSLQLLFKVQNADLSNLVIVINFIHYFDFVQEDTLFRRMREGMGLAMVTFLKRT